VGGFLEVHGIEFFVSAMKQVAQRMPEVEAILVGDGRTRPLAEKLVRELELTEHVRFLGRVPHRQVPTYMNAFDLAMCLYKPVRANPGSSLKLFEYLACGIPVVTSDAPNYREPVAEAEAGAVLELTDSEHCAEGICRLLAHPEDLRRLSANARRYAEEHLSWERTVSQYLEGFSRGCPSPYPY